MSVNKLKFLKYDNKIKLIYFNNSSDVVTSVFGTSYYSVCTTVNKNDYFANFLPHDEPVLPNTVPCSLL